MTLNCLQEICTSLSKDLNKRAKQTKKPHMQYFSNFQTPFLRHTVCLYDNLLHWKSNFFIDRNTTSTSKILYASCLKLLSIKTAICATFYIHSGLNIIKWVIFVTSIKNPRAYTLQIPVVGLDLNLTISFSEKNKELLGPKTANLQ